MNDASIFDGMFSRVWNDGARLDLGAGVNCTGGITAARNSATRRIDISVDAPRVVRSSYSYAGDVTVVEAYADVATALALDGSATTIAMASIADIGFATSLDIRVAHALINGQMLHVDDLRLAVYRRTDGVFELVDRSTALGGVGESAELELYSPSSFLYTLRGAHSGALSISGLSQASEARNVRALIWVGESWAVPAL